uniref:Small ribosomal subunit protein uS2c n=1 Tax=Flabellia petiolata TaxID=189428 RepID=A0A386AX98_9CHLO|nr:ribosomal protein S2 [Flabellia petiolata]
MTVQGYEILQQMVSAGVHFGHRQRNPKMIPYIYTEKDDLQIIDLFQTYWYLKKASLFIFNVCRRGKGVLFVGTRKHVAKCIEQTANDCNSWYINKRWLGGLLTNWETMVKSISKIKRGGGEDLHQNLTKKETARLERKKKRLLKYLGGVRTMSQLKDIKDIGVVIIVGQHKEMNAVRECQKLNIPSLTILDTNCDPSLTDLFIPGNDDSLASVNFILNQLSIPIKKGQKDFKTFTTKTKTKKKSLYKYNRGARSPKASAYNYNYKYN